MDDIQNLIPEHKLKKLTTINAGSIVSNRITVDGQKVGFMYKENRDEDIENDSGWRFIAGDETEEYLDEIDNCQFLPVNTVANYDPAIIPYLKFPIGSELERIKGTDQFQKI